MIEDAIIQISNLKKSFKKLEVLKGVSFEVKKGTILALLGPNGAGKTTIIKILSTLFLPDDGKIKINGFDIIENANEIRKIIGLTGQYAAIDEYLTGRENLEMMGRLYHLSKAESKKRAVELLDQFGLTESAERPAKNYSGGMRRKLDLAASLVATPPLIFLDEPTTGLDPRSRVSMWKIIEELKNAGITILLTTQYLEEADKLADRIIVIDQGKVIAEGTPDELKNKAGNNRLELFFLNDNDLNKAQQLLFGKNISTDEMQNSMTIQIEKGVMEVKEILDKMEIATINIESMSLHKPTLDDVFLSLTGHETQTINNE